MLPQRFWDNVFKTNSCWVWTGNTNGKYGHFWMNGKRYYAHRLSLQNHIGRDILPNMDVCHMPIVCHNTLCVFPEHLREDTRSNNMRDKALDNTNITACRKGSNNGHAKLTDQQVADIRSSTAHVRDLCEQYQMSRSAIYKIKSGRAWG